MFILCIIFSTERRCGKSVCKHQPTDPSVSPKHWKFRIISRWCGKQIEKARSRNVIMNENAFTLAGNAEKDNENRIGYKTERHNTNEQIWNDPTIQDVTKKKRRTCKQSTKWINWKMNYYYEHDKLESNQSIKWTKELTEIANIQRLIKMIFLSISYHTYITSLFSRFQCWRMHGLNPCMKHWSWWVKVQQAKATTAPI